MKLRAKVKNAEVRAFLDSGILDVRSNHDQPDEMPRPYPILAGGAVRAFINKVEEIHDFDVFLLNDVFGMLAQKINEFCLSKWELIFKCPQGLLHSYKTPFGKLQIITPTNYYDVQHLLSTFDLSPSLLAFDGEFLHLPKANGKNIIKDVKKKVANLMNITHPVATMNRIYKYRGYGYKTFQAEESFVRMLTEEGLVIDPANMYARYID